MGKARQKKSKKRGSGRIVKKKRLLETNEQGSENAEKKPKLSEPCENEQPNELVNQDLELQVFLNNIFPLEVLQMIFSHLSTNDLLASRLVCRTWYTASRYEPLWKKFQLDTTNIPYRELEDLLMKMPHIRHIYGRTRGNLVHFILEYVIELDELHCKFNPPLSSISMRKLIKKYPALQAISIDASSGDIVEVVKLLKGCEFLKKLFFYCSFHSYCEYHICVPFPAHEKSIAIFNHISDGFPILEYVDLCPLTYNFDPFTSELLEAFVNIAASRLQKNFGMYFQDGEHGNELENFGSLYVFEHGTCLFETDI